MKHLFYVVMVLSLLFAAVGCSNHLSSQHETELQMEEETALTTPEKPAQVPDDVQEQTENIETVPQEVENTVIETPEVKQQEEKQPEIEMSEVEPPIPPIIEAPEEKPPVPPIVETPEVEPPEVIPPENEPPEIKPPIIEQPKNVLLLINELRTELAATTKRVEYIEFKVVKDCNLNGISVHIMNDAKNPFVYNFSDVNVKVGEYILLHLRTLDDNCKDELGDNLALSGGVDACPTARDLWVAGNEKYLYSTDIVYLQDASGNVMDAVVMNNKPSGAWDKSVSHFQDITEFLYSVGAWESKDGEKPTPYDAVNTSAITNINRSVCRYEWRANHFNTTDWYVTDNKNTFNSPGLPNK